MDNKAIIEFGFRRICYPPDVEEGGENLELNLRCRGGCYSPRPSALVDNTLLDLQNSSYHSQPHSIIAKYTYINRHMLSHAHDDIFLCRPRSWGSTNT